MTSEYKKGVEIALKNFEIQEVWSLIAATESRSPAGSPEWYTDIINSLIEDRSDKLLTKEVTKWINIYGINSTACNASILLYDTELEAKMNIDRGRFLPFHSTHSIEMRVPLD